MKLFTKKTGLGIIFLVMFIITSVLGIAQPFRGLETETHDVIINDAYYIEYDIIVKITAIVQTTSPNENYYLQVELINPLGESHIIILHIITSIEILDLEITFYNYVTAPGDYTVNAAIVSNDDGWFAVTDTVVFDPPGSSEGDPVIGIRII